MLFACGEPERLAERPEPADAGAGPDRGVGDAGWDGGSADAGWDAGGADAGTADTGTADAGSDAGAVDGGTPPPVVRFVAVGDTGEGNEAQYAVSRSIETVCMVQGCDFVLLLGDNFYGRGVDDVDDPQFQTKFEMPYANLQLPFYVTLGNHDHGWKGVEIWRSEHQIEYSARSTKWNMPDHFYAFVKEHVTFVSVDTNMVMLGLDWVRDQKDWCREQLDAATTPWVVAYGHHPYRSNGEHGNAGHYEGPGGQLDPTGITPGDNVRDFIEDEACGKVDLLLAGHDHNLQWLESHCGMALVVSGAGAKTTPFVHRDANPTRFETDEVEGFFWFEIRGDRMTLEAWDRDGQRLHRGEVERNQD